MRKFRFIGDPNNYGWDQNPEYGRIYTINELDRIRGGEELHYDDLTSPNSDLSEDFEEVFDETPRIKTISLEEAKRIGILVENGLPRFNNIVQINKLHKDTDLGYFVAVLLKAGFNIHTVVSDAKTLIKELDDELERNK